MMIDPITFAEFELKGKSYKQLLRIRKELLHDIYFFEKGRTTPEEWAISPSADVVYQMNLEYLAECCKAIQEAYNTEYVWGKYENPEFLDSLKSNVLKGMGS